MNHYQELLDYDLSRFLDGHKNYGFDSKQDMINAGLYALRYELRVQATKDLQDDKNGQQRLEVVISN